MMHDALQANRGLQLFCVDGRQRKHERVPRTAVATTVPPRRKAHDMSKEWCDVICIYIFMYVYMYIYIYIISIYVCIIYYTYMTGFCNHTQRIYVCKATICAKSRQRPLRQLCQAENCGGGELPVNNNAMLNDKQLNQT